MENLAKDDKGKITDNHDSSVLIKLVKWLQILQVSDISREESVKLDNEITALKNIIVRCNCYIGSQEFFPKEINKITALIDYDLSRK